MSKTANKFSKLIRMAHNALKNALLYLKSMSAASAAARFLSLVIYQTKNVPEIHFVYHQGAKPDLASNSDCTDPTTVIMKHITTCNLLLLRNLELYANTNYSILEEITPSLCGVGKVIRVLFRDVMQRAIKVGRDHFFEHRY